MDLEARRISLIASINDLEKIKMPGDQDTARIQSTKQAYNQLVETIRYQGPHIDPIKLPLELWTEILIYAIYAAFCQAMSCSSFATVHNFRLVSKRWHKCVMESPTLWAYIVLSDKYSDAQPSCVDRFLHLSRTSDLHLLFKRPMVSWRVVCDKIAAHRSRIKSIWFYNLRAENDPITGIPAGDPVDSILRHLSPLSRLTDMIGGFGDIDWLLDQGTPLEHISGGGPPKDIVSLSALARLRARNIREINTLRDIELVLPFVHHIPFVETIRFLENGSFLPSRQPGAPTSKDSIIPPDKASKMP